MPMLPRRRYSLDDYRWQVPMFFGDIRRSEPSMIANPNQWTGESESPLLRAARDTYAPPISTRPSFWAY